MEPTGMAVSIETRFLKLPSTHPQYMVVSI